MKLTIQRETLLEPLQLVIGVVERRQTLPILANVLLTIDNQTLSITATDLEIELIGTANLPEPVEEKAQVTVSGRKLLDICKTLPAESIIELQKEKERVIMRSGRSRFILATLPVESFPAFDETESNIEFTTSQQGLGQLLHRTHFAMAQQDVRYYLNGMLVELKHGNIRTVATDGHRFAMNVSANPEMEQAHMAQVIVPRKGILELMRLLKNDDSHATTLIGQNFVRVKGEKFTFTSKLIDGRFPDYERVLPQEKGQTIIVDRDTLREALMRVAILSNEKFRAIKLQLRAGLLHILANNPDQEEAEEMLAVDYSGPELDMGFNVSYLLDVLNTLEADNVKLNFMDTNNRMFIKEAKEEKENATHSALFLVMPLQL